VLSKTKRRAPVRPKIARRRSRIAGFGVFAAQAIAKDRRIVHYDGELISHAESDRREQRHLKAGRIWCFTVNRRWVRDASVGGNIARFINHACRPNCWTKVVGRTIWIQALRRIEKGEELLYDYSTGGAAKIRCRCRPGCRRVL
jgi:SET domain-containing protein